MLVLDEDGMWSISVAFTGLILVEFDGNVLEVRLYLIQLQVLNAFVEVIIWSGHRALYDTVDICDYVDRTHELDVLF